jgi:hypothetical protein
LIPEEAVEADHLFSLPQRERERTWQHLAGRHDPETILVSASRFGTKALVYFAAPNRDGAGARGDCRGQRPAIHDRNREEDPESMNQYDDAEPSPHDRNYDTLDSAATSLEQSLEALQGAGLVADLRQREADLRAIEKDLGQARGRGYLYANDTEFLISDAKAALPAALQRVEALAAEARNGLARQAADVLGRARTLADTDLSYADGDVSWISAEASRIADEVDGLKDRAGEAAAEVINFIDDAGSSVNRALFTLDLLEGASFPLQPGEDILFALNAAYRNAPGKGTVNGVLFFTNHRVRFELRDEIVTERTFLIFASKKEQVRELLLDEPLGKMTASDDLQEGVMFKDEILRFSWSPGVRCPIKTEFELQDGENAKDWDATIEMIRTGVLEQTRVNTAPPVPVYTFPTECHGCGAPLPGTVKGQTICKCTYCRKDHLGVAG